MNPFLIRMLQKSRQGRPPPSDVASRGMGRVYGVAVAFIALLIVTIVAVELSRAHGGNAPWKR